jgi:hypothetical protein
MSDQNYRNGYHAPIERWTNPDGEPHTGIFEHVRNGGSPFDYAPPPVVLDELAEIARALGVERRKAPAVDMATVTARVTGDNQPTRAQVRHVRRLIVSAGGAVKRGEGKKAHYWTTIPIAECILGEMHRRSRPEIGDVCGVAEILRVLDERDASGAVLVECRCVAEHGGCSKRFVARRYELARGRVKSCGCLKRECQRGFKNRFFHQNRG